MYSPAEDPASTQGIDFPLGVPHHVRAAAWGAQLAPGTAAQDRPRWAKPPLGCPTSQDGVTGTSGCSSVHPQSCRSLPPALPGVLGSRCTPGPRQEPNPDLGPTALSPGTLVPHRCEQPEQTRSVCRAAAGMLAPSPARCRAGGSLPLPAASPLPPAPRKGRRLLGV